ncbi:hypothetical protein EWI07_11095 [Sporolactobacillus sp. THM7-4]|nr:hypothetical protein EWI07_11095 [Sporolactobacillus sp. THM7-4]
MKKNKNKIRITFSHWGKSFLVLTTLSTLSVPGIQEALASSSTQAANQVTTTSTQAAVATQSNQDPSKPNAVTNNVGGNAKTVSSSTAEQANIQTAQSTPANYATVQITTGKSATIEGTLVFIHQIGDEARSIAKANDLYASVMIAQAILESASGQSGLTKEANNLFGIKGSYNGQYVAMKTYEDDGTGHFVQVTADFRKYPSTAASLQDYANLLKNGVSWNHTYYSKVWKSNASTYLNATAALQGTYSSDTTYASKLDQLISQYNLTQFDNAASDNLKSSNSSLAKKSHSTSAAPMTRSSAVTVGSTIRTNGVLYASSSSRAPLKTRLTAVKVSKIYSSAKNPYQVTNKGVVVGYLRATESTKKTTGTSATPATRSSSVTVGSTIRTNGVLYASSSSRAPLKTRLTTVKVRRIYSSAKNPYQVTNKGVVVGYLR